MTATADPEIPVGRNHIIERPRLTRLLDETTARVIMLVAPAGYGKTTLARQWLATHAHVWYQGSAASSDVAALALGIADAAGTILPGVGERLREWLPTSREPEREVGVIAELLSEDLAEWPDDVWFVIDDYHLLASEASVDLTQRLFIGADRRLLLTSRRRPDWASARELLYGTFLELGQSTLAMTTDEANAVLTNHAQAASGLVALANGWPAVIGLAALASTPFATEGGLPDALYDYFAEELFASLPEPARVNLCRLAMLPTLEREAAIKILGTSAQETLEHARQSGLFVAGGPDRLALHPLLQSFLLRKLRELSEGDLDAVIAIGVSYFADVASWDEAFFLISDFERVDLLDILYSRSMMPLLKQGRVATLREWLTFSARHGHHSSYRDLAESEIRFREGLYDQAEVLAYGAASALREEDPLKSAAYFRAGQSSYLTDKPAQALAHSRAAGESAQTAVDRRNALWGEFNALIELEHTGAARKLREFATVGPQDRDTMVRLTSGRLVVAVRCGGLSTALAEARAISESVSTASDPTIRSSFSHAYAVALRLKGEYEAALTAIDESEQIIRAYSTEFALPHVLVNRAAALIGLRRFQEAAHLAAKVEASAEKTGDCYLLASTAMLQCRLALQRGIPEEEVATTGLGLVGQWIEDRLSKSMQAELRMTRAAVHVHAGDPGLALRAVRENRHLSCYCEPELLASWIRAVCSLVLERPTSDSLIHAAYKKTLQSTAFDLLVFAYRLHPAILPVLVRHDPDARGVLSDVVLNARDGDLASRFGLALPRGAVSESRHSTLTKREQEVYSLLAEGKTNREIASALFISELTAKVHVGRVLRKLGVRSRTQAALKAARDTHYER